MKRTIVVAASIAVAGSVAYLGYAKLGRKAPAVASDREGNDEAAPGGAAATQAWEIARLRREMALLRSEVAAAREAAAGKPSGQPGEATASDPKADKAAPPERKATSDAWHAHMQEVDTNFRKEPFDNAWAANMTIAVKEAAGKHNAVSKALQKVECRSETCRVELTYDGSFELSEQMPFFLQDTVPNLPTMQAEPVDVRSGGSKTMVLYLTKEKTGA
jgi:hypothetical protein